MKTKKLLKVISIILAIIMFVQIIPTSVVALAADELTESETIEPDVSNGVAEETPATQGDGSLVLTKRLENTRGRFFCVDENSKI